MTVKHVNYLTRPSVAVIDMLNQTSLLIEMVNNYKKARAIVTAEDHSVIGGLGSIAEHRSKNILFDEMIGVQTIS